MQGLSRQPNLELAIEGSGDGEEPSKKKRGRKPKYGTASTKNCDTSWGAIRALNLLSLAPSLHDYLQFTADKYVSMYSATEVAILPQIRENAPEVEILLIQAHQISIMSDAMTLKHDSWLFLVLMVGDMDRRMFGDGPMTRARRDELTGFLLRN